MSGWAPHSFLWVKSRLVWNSAKHSGMRSPASPGQPLQIHEVFYITSFSCFSPFWLHAFPILLAAPLCWPVISSCKPGNVILRWSSWPLKSWRIRINCVQECGTNIGSLPFPLSVHKVLRSQGTLHHQSHEQLLIPLVRFSQDMQSIQLLIYKIHSSHIMTVWNDACGLLNNISISILLSSGSHCKWMSCTQDINYIWQSPGTICVSSVFCHDNITMIVICSPSSVHNNFPELCRKVCLWWSQWHRYHYYEIMGQGYTCVIIINE